MKHETYVRKAKVARVVNANTLDLDIDLGFGVTLQQRVDLARISPMDQFERMGLEAKVYLGETFRSVRDVTLQFDYHPEDRRRFIAEVWLDNGVSLNETMLMNKLGTLDESLTVNVLG